MVKEFMLNQLYQSIIDVSGIIILYRGGQQKTSLDFRVVLRAYLSDRAELWRSPSVANRWLFVMVVRCL